MDREDTYNETSSTMNQFNTVASIMPLENLSIHPNSTQPWPLLQSSHSQNGNEINCK